MARFRFPLARLSAVVLVTAIAFAAARSPDEYWANGAFSFALLVLGVATLGAIFRRGPARAYWGGFALLGWGYMLVAFGPWCDGKIAPLLITKTICEDLHFRFGGALPTRPFIRPIPGTGLMMFGYQQIGHSLTALLLGLLGGMLARRFADPGASPADGPSNRVGREASPSERAGDLA